MNELALATIETFRNRVFEGDALTLLNSLPSNSIDCCISSPPYFALRSYLPDDHPDKALEMGSEQTPEAYIAGMVKLFREVRRVLKPTGTCWVNLGDSYAGSGKGPTGMNGVGNHEVRQGFTGSGKVTPSGYKPKDLMMIPHRVAIALQQDGWYVRMDCIWHKPNPMPESVTDRPTKAHEYIFLLTKAERYYYDAEAIAEQSSSGEGTKAGYAGYSARAEAMGRVASGNEKPGAVAFNSVTRNKRSVWTIATQPYAEAHFATFPEALPETCIKAGCPVTVCAECGKPHERVTAVTGETEHGGLRKRADAPGAEVSPTSVFRTGRIPVRETTGFAPTCTCNGDTEPGIVLDPFFGSGTTGVMAKRLERDYIGAELNPDYAALARKRIADDNPFQDRELVPGIVQKSLFALN